MRIRISTYPPNLGHSFKVAGYSAVKPIYDDEVGLLVMLQRQCFVIFVKPFKMLIFICFYFSLICDQFCLEVIHIFEELNLFQSLGLVLQSIFHNSINKFQLKRFY